jgi:hypothetical protein
VLIVEPQTILRLQLGNVAEKIGAVDTETGMPNARHRLSTTSYSWLVTNMRLDAYNGLHLAYLAKMWQTPIGVLVYGDRDDLLLAREAQQLGFFESRLSITYTLHGYLTSLLPPTDRRDATNRDRRGLFRGGRRSSDTTRYQEAGQTAGVRIQASPVRLVRDW